MKILQINKFLKAEGGAETYMFQLSAALKEKGIDVRFWGMYDDDNIVDDFPSLLADSVDYSNQGIISKLNSTISTVYSKKNRNKIAKVLDIYQPDIVHIHNYNFQLTPSVLPEIKKRNIPIVQTIHDSQMVCPYHRLFNFQRNQVCTKCIEGSFFNCIKDRCFDGSVLKSLVGSAESMLYHSLGYYEKHIDFYISPSQFLANLINKRISKEINVIPNFTLVSNEKVNIYDSDYYLYYGRISGEKGVLELIDLFSTINLNLVIVGKGPLDKIVINRINNKTNINFLGPKYGDDLYSIIKKAKYVIQPSKWFENCPMTIIESFALNTPVIGSNHSGFRDLIEHNITGYLLDFEKIDKARIELIKINKEPVDLLKKNISSYYEDNLSPKVHLEKILEIYNKMTSS
ncbi:glycosyltransferase [Winogradskyella flava]|uniref:Glycosyltransferase family 4 protein n=1 Tax=Winogradskyella flava TaxID=1884876 RepID=A0A842IQ58_9FLAO|nr:glycosyltransferase family 4 protein [Winogradskyella flava]